METEQLPKIYTYVKVIEMKLSNDMKDGAWTGHLLSQIEDANIRNGLHIIELIVKSGPMRTFQYLRLFARLYCWKKKKATQFIKPKVNLLESPLLWLSRMYCACCQQRKVNIKSAKTSGLKWWPACKLCQWKSCTKLLRLTNQYLTGFQVGSMRWNPHLSHHVWPRTWN